MLRIASRIRTYDPSGFGTTVSSKCNGSTRNLAGGGGIVLVSTNSQSSDLMSLGDEVLMDADYLGNLAIPLPDAFGQDVAISSGARGTQSAINPCAAGLDGGMNCQNPTPPGLPNDNGTTPDADGVNSTGDGAAHNVSGGGVQANSDNPPPTPNPGTSARKRAPSLESSPNQCAAQLSQDYYNSLNPDQGNGLSDALYSNSFSDLSNLITGGGDGRLSSTGNLATGELAREGPELAAQGVEMSATAISSAAVNGGTTQVLSSTGVGWSIGQSTPISLSPRGRCR